MTATQLSRFPKETGKNHQEVCPRQGGRGGGKHPSLDVKGGGASNGMALKGEKKARIFLGGRSVSTG